MVVPRSGFDENQSEGQSNEQSGHEDASFPGRHLALIMFTVPGHRDDEGHLANIGWLETRRTKAEPPSRSIYSRADVLD